MEIDGAFYVLKDDSNTWILTKLAGYSNYVVINAAWTADPYGSVMDGDVERFVGIDAANSLDSAVEYIRGYNEGTGFEPDGNATAVGTAKMELVKGSYVLSNDKYLMTAENGVTNLTLAARDGAAVTVGGRLHASDKGDTLTVKNVSFSSWVFGGGNLIINNAEAAKTTARLIAGLDNASCDFATKITLNGGTFTGNIIGGSFSDNAATSITVSGTTSVTVGGSDAVSVTGYIYGASYATTAGNVEQTGDASVTVDASSSTVSIRGNIYASGEGITMNGDTTVTFKGDADRLTFTGRVSANATDYDELLVFDGFSGKFNGSILGFDSIVIIGETSLELGRRQTQTKETTLQFVLDGAGADAEEAMFIVRDSDSWEFSKTVIINVTGAAAGSYVLVGNYDGVADQAELLDKFDFEAADGADLESMIRYENNQIILDYAATNNIALLSNDLAAFSNDGGLEDLASWSAPEDKSLSALTNSNEEDLLKGFLA